MVEVSPSTEMRLKLTSMASAQIAVEDCWLDGGVGEDVDEHGGMRHQLRMNHAGAFADSRRCGSPGGISPGPSISGVVDFDAREGGLLYGVGGDDGLGDLLEVVGL